MCFVTTRPEALVAAAGNLAALGSALAAQNGAAAAPTTTVTPAAADPVSALQAAQFSTYGTDRKSTRLNSSHVAISYAVFCLKKKKKNNNETNTTSTLSR